MVNILNDMITSYRNDEKNFSSSLGLLFDLSLSINRRSIKKMVVRGSVLPNFLTKSVECVTSKKLQIVIPLL